MISSSARARWRVEVFLMTLFTMTIQSIILIVALTLAIALAAGIIAGAMYLFFLGFGAYSG